MLNNLLLFNFIKQLFFLFCSARQGEPSRADPLSSHDVAIRLEPRGRRGPAGGRRGGGAGPRIPHGRHQTGRVHSRGMCGDGATCRSRCGGVVKMLFLFIYKKNMLIFLLNLIQDFQDFFSLLLTLIEITKLKL